MLGRIAGLASGLLKAAPVKTMGRYAKVATDRLGNVASHPLGGLALQTAATLPVELAMYNMMFSQQPELVQQLPPGAMASNTMGEMGMDPRMQVQGYSPNAEEVDREIKRLQRQAAFNEQYAQLLQAQGRVG